MRVTIQADRFFLDGVPTYSDFPGVKPEALGRLMNSRMVQATFEDENPETGGLFAYPDGSSFDPDRQTREFIAMLPAYRRYGVLAATVNFQGGYPIAHTSIPRSEHLQRWENNAFTPDGTLKWRYAERMRRVIEAADAAAMALMVGFFYFGQNHKLQDEAAVKRAVVEATRFLMSVDRDNVLIEINNECNISYVHEILQPERVHELIDLARQTCGGRFAISTSYGGGALPGDNVLAASDYVLLHGNGQNPESVRRMVEQTRARTGKPIVFNEDSVRIDNMRAAWEAGASWGYYDQGQNDYRQGFQSVPTNWAINTPEKQAFFRTVAELAGIAVADGAIA